MCKLFHTGARCKDISYAIPSIWMKGWEDIFSLEKTKTDKVLIDIEEFYPAILNYYLKIAQEKQLDSRKSLSQLKNENANGNWIKQSVIYAMYIRSALSWDHNDDGELGGNSEDITINSDGIRETGTFLKTMLILPYLKSLGVNTLYLLPVAQSGTLDKKGELPSPYSQKNPFRIEPTLADPIVNFSPEIQFAALVEACHAVDIRVVVDFIFRTASKDSDWIIENPEWFYWIDKTKKKDYKSPQFSDNELKEINKIAHDRDNVDMIPPNAEYTNMFKNPPTKDAIKWDNEFGYTFLTEDNKECIIPGAFADWPPDDIQPPWSDVTYLKLYNDENFNYIAYNTIRMYDRRIKDINSGLWKKLSDVIPFYQTEFGIDGARIDMGHALPAELEKNIVQCARDIDPDFAFISENFDPKGEKPDSGYNAIWGSAWYMQHRLNDPHGKYNFKNRLKEFVDEIATNPLAILGAPETNDTPRIATYEGGLSLTEFLLKINFYLPGVIPFLHAGIEFGELEPSNLGLDFEMEYIKNFKGKLALFDRTSLNWKKNNIQELISKLSVQRSELQIHEYAKYFSTFQLKNGLWGFSIDSDKLCLIALINSTQNTISLNKNDIEQIDVPQKIKTNILDKYNSFEIEALKAEILI